MSKTLTIYNQQFCVKTYIIEILLSKSSTWLIKYDYSYYICSSYNILNIQIFTYYSAMYGIPYT